MLDALARELHDQIAFLQARPTKTMNPIWVSNVVVEPFNQTPAIADNRHMGTMRMTARGSAQLSYCADRIKKHQHERRWEKPEALYCRPTSVETSIGPLVAKAIRQNFFQHPFHGRRGLAGRDAGCALPIESAAR